MKFDPRTKIIFFTSAFTLAFLFTEIIELIILASITLVLSFFSVERNKIFGRLKIMAPVFLVAFVLWTFLNQYSLFHVYDGVNVMTGVFMTLRLFLIVVLSLAFVSFVTPVELVNALASFRLPYKLVFTLGLSLRHISTVSDEYIAIKEGQTSRGLELDKGFLVRRIKNYNSVVMPLLIRSIENAEKLVLAMELKSFSLNGRRRYSVGKLNSLDYVVIFSMIAVVFIFLLRNFLW
ncbi:MAG: energy-coupling factor transporter transmembrane protein EcfT [Nitrososphaeria archaeon]|nr:energy-coupling factor transporter transmembrane protein EcfT [Nitrososphaeria archaeon]